MKRNLKALIVCLLPIIALAAWTLRLRYQGASGVDVDLPVEGFDPRDPISGHYVTYRLALGFHDPCRPGEGDLIDRDAARCLCFDDNPKPQVNWAGACSAKPDSCRLYLKGQCPWSGFTAGVERFHIPEADSPFLAVVPPKSRVILSLTGDGSALVKAFLPAGENYAEWIQKRKSEQPRDP